MAALHVTADNFEAEVLKSEKVVVADFWASWCGPCMMMGPIIDQLAEEESSVKYVKVNVDENPKLAIEYDVEHIPTLVVFHGGRDVKKSVGAISRQEILQLTSDVQ